MAFGTPSVYYPRWNSGRTPVDRRAPENWSTLSWGGNGWGLTGKGSGLIVNLDNEKGHRNWTQNGKLGLTRQKESELAGSSREGRFNKELDMWTADRELPAWLPVVSASNPSSRELGMVEKWARKAGKWNSLSGIWERTIYATWSEEKKNTKKGGGEEIRIHYLVYKMSGFFILKNLHRKNNYFILRICSIRCMHSGAFTE